MPAAGRADETLTVGGLMLRYEPGDQIERERERCGGTSIAVCAVTVRSLGFWGLNDADDQS